jgi:hypothetical protein
VSADAVGVVGARRRPEGFREFFSAWADARVEAEQFRELDGGRVLVLFHGAGRGKASGITLPSDELRAHFFHFREGKITRFLTYFRPRPRSRRPRAGGVGGVTGEMMTTYTPSPTTDENAQFAGR